MPLNPEFWKRKNGFEMNIPGVDPTSWAGPLQQFAKEKIPSFCPKNQPGNTIWQNFS